MILKHQNKIINLIYIWTLLKKNYIFPIYSKFYELQDDFTNQSQIYKDEV